MRIDLLPGDRDAGPQPALRVDSSAIPASPTPPEAASAFDILLQALYDAAILTGFDGTIANANERALQFFDYRSSAICTLHIDNLIAGAGPDLLATVIDNVNTNRFTLVMAHCIRSDGSLFPAEISATCLRLPPQPYLCFFIRDTTLRRDIEKHLRTAYGAVHNAGGGIAITDPGGMITYANPAMGRLWSHDDSADLSAMQMQQLFDNPRAVQGAIRNAVTHKRWHGELKGRRQDGTDFYVLTSITSCLDEDGALTDLVFSFIDTTQRHLDEEALRRYRDHLEDLIRERTADLETGNRDLKREIRERVRVEEELHNAIRKLRDHDASKSLFVSNVSHELRTPLTSLIHAVENLMRGVVGSVSDPVYSYLGMMLEDCWRLERTIGDILDLSRIESGRLILNTSCAPFRRLVERVVNTLRREADSVPLTLCLETGTAVGFVECDTDKMERTLTNIIGNAIKFTPADGTVRITLAAKRHGDVDGICCQITDSGIGIPPEHIERVTERFFRVGEQVGGTGLGLSIAKEITERHQGTLDIISPPPGADKGTRVSLWLPAATPPQVMVVAHDNAFCKAITPVLRQHGYQTVCYDTGQHALQRLHDGKQSAVIVDSLIPDMDGTEIVMHIKADAVLRSTPVLFLSEEYPSPAKSTILQGFGIPILLKAGAIARLADAIDTIFLPPRNGSRTQRTAPGNAHMEE